MPKGCTVYASTEVVTMALVELKQASATGAMGGDRWASIEVVAMGLTVASMPMGCAMA